MESEKGSPVIVCTKHRGVFFGFAEDHSGGTVDLKQAKMAIYWGTTKGVMQLADTGPTDKSRISAPCDVRLHDVTAVLHVKPGAADKWLTA